MRVLFLIRSLEPGGAERQLVLLANGLAKKGHRVGVIVFYPGGQLEEMLDGVQLHSLDKKGRWDVLGFWSSLIRCVREFRPDVLHGYLGTANNLSVLAKSALPKLKVVLGIRSTNVDFVHYGKLARLDSAAMSLLSRFADCVIANSHKGKKDALGRGVSNNCFRVVPNGIDTDRFTPAIESGRELRKAWGAADTDIVIGVVGRLDPMKGQGLVLDAAQSVLDEGVPARFVFVGGGPMADMLESEARRLDLSRHVVWAGYQAGMPSVYNAIDVCCLGSLFGEGFPNVLGEAMSCGVPCVSSDVGDAALVIGDTGIVVPPGDTQALTRGLLDMCNRLTADASVTTRQRIVGHFSLQAMIDKTENVLLKVASG